MPDKESVRLLGHAQHGDSVMIASPDVLTTPRELTSKGGVLDVVRNMWFLGLVAFGGPPGHLSLERKLYVEKRKWLSSAQFAELLGIASSIPGPSSTQVTVAIGLLRGGVLGSLVALGFFLIPAAVVLAALGQFLGSNTTVADWRDNSFIFQAVEGGLGSASVAVIIAAALKLCNSVLAGSRFLQGISMGACCMSLLYRSWWTYPVIIFGSGIVCLVKKNRDRKNGVMDKQGSAPQEELPIHISRWQVLFFALLYSSILIFLMVGRHSFGKDVNWIVYCEIFFRIGSVVLGGGYVVVPMLITELVDSGFLDQAQLVEALVLSSLMPGPMFAISSYLSAILGGPIMALLGCACLFAPGVLFLYIVLHFWKWMRQQHVIRDALPGINSAAIGLIFQSAITLGLGIMKTDEIYYLVCIMAYYVHDRIGLDVPWTILIGGVLGLAFKELDLYI
eukprot:ANDGO_00556.mRNA.1 Putative uncharacterized transporter MJ0718